MMKGRTIKMGGRVGNDINKHGYDMKSTDCEE